VAASDLRAPAPGSAAREEEVAERVLRSLVHRGLAPDAGVETLVVPAGRFNGDLLLTARHPGGRLHLLLGDFIGHGLQAAIGALPAAETFRTMTAKGFAIGEIATELNSKLRELLPTSFFLAAVLVELDFEHQRLTLWNGGLPDVLRWRPGVGVVQRFPSRHLPLAIQPDAQFDAATQVATFLPDDRLLVHSDGLIELRSPDGEPFGEARHARVVRAETDGARLRDAVRAEVDAFRRGRAPDDDLTLAVVACRPVERIGEPADGAEPDAARAQSLPWSTRLRLEADALAAIDPLPLLLQSVAELHGPVHERTTLFLVLQELYSNAVDHGVLRLDSRQKRDAAGFDAYLKRRAAALRDLRDGFVEIELSQEPLADGGRLRVRVHDSGPGFVLESVQLQDSGGEVLQLCGRGLALVQSVCEGLTVTGSVVEAVMRWKSSGRRDRG
jgi:anti-sigma regulatory factor (Ser/Thr protein kinase)